MSENTDLGDNIPRECIVESLKEIGKMVQAHEDILTSTRHLFRMYISAGKPANEALALIRVINKECAEKARENQGADNDGSSNSDY